MCSWGWDFAGTPISGLGKAWSKGMDVFSLASILGLGATKECNFLLFLLHQSLVKITETFTTYDRFWLIFGWSMNALWEGKWPSVDYRGVPIHSDLAGTPLMGGFFMVLWSIAADLDFLMTCFRLPNTNSNTPCSLCPCNSRDMPWWDFRTTARWIEAVYTPETWRLTGQNKSKLWDVIGVSILTVYPDWMHIKHLGLDKDLLGSILCLLVEEVLSCMGSPAVVLDYVWHKIDVIYTRDRTSCQYTHLKPSMLRTKDGPRLKGKANEIKHLGPVVALQTPILQCG